MGKRADTFGFYLRGRTWYTLDPVERRVVSTRCRDLDAARAWRAARERLAADPAAQAAQAATLGDECRMMLDALTAAGRPTTYYEHYLGQWTRILGNDCPLAEVGPAAFDRFIAVRRGEVTNHTISKGLKCMVTTLRQAKRAGRWSGDLSTLRPLGFSAGYVPRTRALTPAELAALLGVLAPAPRAFVALCVALGLRLGEALALRPGDVDQAAWVVRVRGTKTKGSLRDLPVLEPFRPLVAMATRELPLDAWARKRHFSERLDVACRRAGIPRCTPNDLRRTHATLLRNGGVDASTARALLGHTRGSVLLEQTYDKPRPAELAARAGALAPLAAALAPIAESLQSAPAPAILTAKTAVRFRHGGRSITSPAREDKHLARSSATNAVPQPGAAGTESLHPPAALALALAAERVLRPRVHWITVVRTGEAERVG